MIQFGSVNGMRASKLLVSAKCYLTYGIDIMGHNDESPCFNPEDVLPVAADTDACKNESMRRFITKHQVCNNHMIRSVPGKPHLENKNKWNRQFAVRSLEYAKDLVDMLSQHLLKRLLGAVSIKPLPEPMMIQIPDAKLLHWATMVQLRNQGSEFKELCFLSPHPSL